MRNENADPGHTTGMGVDHPKVSATSLTDAQLIVDSVDDAERFAEVYDRHFDSVLAFHYRRTRCAQTAADLTSETFAAAFTSRSRFRDTGAPARAWLFKIARRQLAHYRRREAVSSRARRRLGVDVEALHDTDVERIEALADSRQMLGDLDRALADLPDGQAEAVRLRVGMDLPYADVAARLGCSEGAARVRVCRGLARLIDDLGEER
jgi:RNA polymerase sigma-70 factor (ECF subfamily)